MATWTFDPSHTSAAFAARHMMISTVRGSFRNVTGTLEYDPDHIEKASVDVKIVVSQMSTTGVGDRDNHLKSADFLDMEHYPYLTFTSHRVEPTGPDSARVIGDLTIRDVTREVVIEAQKLGQLTGMQGKLVAGFQGSTSINREDFGLTWNMAIEGGGVLVGKEISISLEVEAVLAEEAALA
jgi:polyisoprenoid-binding protein YceI